MMQTDPASFRNPHTRANRVARLLWQCCWALLFRPTPWFAGGWRSTLLKWWGARLGHCRFDASVKIWSPWKLAVGTHAYVDAGVNLYNAFGITLGDRVIISQGCFLCTASHDYTDPAYALTGAPIVIEDDCWIAAQAFIGPGVTIGRGSVVGARAVVVKDVPPGSVVAGNPARVIKQRILRQPSQTP